MSCCKLPASAYKARRHSCVSSPINWPIRKHKARPRKCDLKPMRNWSKSSPFTKPKVCNTPWFFCPLYPTSEKTKTSHSEHLKSDFKKTSVCCTWHLRARSKRCGWALPNAKTISKPKIPRPKAPSAFCWDEHPLTICKKNCSSGRQSKIFPLCQHQKPMTACMLRFSQSKMIRPRLQDNPHAHCLEPVGRQVSVHSHAT